jgi:hypothetical protein
VLANGHGAVLARESGVTEGEWLVALDLQPAPRGERSEALVRCASLIERSWLTATRRSLDHELDPNDGRVRAFERDWYDELVLAERAVPPDPEAASRLLAAAIAARGIDERALALRRRIRFAGIPWDESAWIDRACAGRRALSEVDLASRSHATCDSPSNASRPSRSPSRAGDGRDSSTPRTEPCPPR